MMTETIEYFGTIIKPLTSQDLGKDEIIWSEGETVIVKEFTYSPNFRIIKLKNRLKSMVVKGPEFTYYKPEWVKLR